MVNLSRDLKRLSWVVLANEECHKRGTLSVQIVSHGDYKM